MYFIKNYINFLHWAFIFKIQKSNTYFRHQKRKGKNYFICFRLFILLTELQADTLCMLSRYHHNIHNNMERNLFVNL